ncbi:MAG TPA: bifunctional diaminohydroxyphosphoribosylaminopyrimidine deaminase/5-amino-6-(5-phosphoribosylamino)uracil reductase RibD [Steroidobacteraceae bacterium]
MFTAFDQAMMRRALELAALGRYTTHPNPRVGCVVVQDERIVGEGWHRKWGEPHAEPIALAAAGEAARGATVYVTLEPHCFQGRTPPCTDALIKAGVKRVVCGALDPNPRVSGAGLAQLREAGIEVAHGLLEEEAHALNRGFDKRMRTGLPRVRLKIAASLDGRVALANGASRWITGESARADVQRLRAESSAILTGIDTVIADDPLLTVRDPAIDLAGRIPVRVVLDTHLRMPATARMLHEKGEILVFTAASLNSEQAERLRAAGAEVRQVAVAASGRLDLSAVLRELGDRLCNDVLVEAGGTLSGRMLEEGLVDELILYLAPKVLGADARPMVELRGLTALEQAPHFELAAIDRFGDDLRLTYKPRGN